MSILPDQMYGDEGIRHNSYEDGEDNDEDSDVSIQIGGPTGSEYEFWQKDRYAREMNRLLKSLEIWDEVDLLDGVARLSPIKKADNWNEKCRRFLSDNNIRPEFFCQYRGRHLNNIDTLKRGHRKRPKSVERFRSNDLKLPTEKCSPTPRSKSSDRASQLRLNGGAVILSDPAVLKVSHSSSVQIYNNVPNRFDVNKPGRTDQIRFCEVSHNKNC